MTVWSSIRWHPAKTSNYARRRAGYQPIAVVYHRMVGWLLGTRRYFTVSSERPVSTHFGIGHEARNPVTGALRPLCPECGPITGARGPLVVDQYVDLCDTAFGNGNYDPSGGWTATIKNNGDVVNPNLYTVSIEHEDGSTAGHGIVTSHVRRASVELTKLLHSGDVATLRAAGIRIGGQAWHSAGDASATGLALRRIPVASERFIDHHRVAGRLKPYCWQPWLSDKGYGGGGTHAAVLHALAPAPAPAPAPSASNIIAIYDRVRLRNAPRITGKVMRSCDRGDRARTSGNVAGGAFIVNGKSGRTWRRITAVDGHLLPAPLYAALPLWRSI